MGKLRVAIVGVGNCASSLVQGVHFYAGAEPGDHVPGLMHVELGGYHVRDIEFVAAFDVDAKKVGRDLSEAIRSGENNTIQFADVPPLGVEVQRGPTLDGLGQYYAETIHESDAAPVDVAVALAASGADVLVCYLPVGSEEAARFYAEQALKAAPSGPSASPGPGCRSSATTSSRRSGRPSSTAC
jgi:myo-inositol-1-phosphate synthase